MKYQFSVEMILPHFVCTTGHLFLKIRNSHIRKGRMLRLDIFVQRLATHISYTYTVPRNLAVQVVCCTGSQCRLQGLYEVCHRTGPVC